MVQTASRAVEQSAPRQIAGVILAGGRNSRMGGSDKAFLRLEGEFVIDRMLRVMGQLFSPLIVVTNDPEKYSRYDVCIARDEFPRRGPLAGIHAGLGQIERPYACVVACDMPFLRIEPLRYLVDRIDQQDAIIPCWDGDIEPLHGIYAASLRVPIEEALRSGVSAIRDFLPRISVEYVPEPTLRLIEGADESFRNVNTPEEAARFAIQLLQND